MNSAQATKVRKLGSLGRIFPHSERDPNCRQPAAPPYAGSFRYPGIQTPPHPIPLHHTPRKTPPSSLSIIGPFSFHFFPQNFLNPLNHLQAPISGSIPLACYPWWMSTTKRIATNRRNALNSGRPLGRPRSAEGKAASSANSLKTSLYARSQVIAGEDPAELRALAGQYFLRWQPATPEESFLVATLIDAEWLLRRYSLADAKIWGYKGADDCVRDDPNGVGINFIRWREYFPLLQRRADSALRAFHRALHDLERFQSKRLAEAPPADPKPSAALPPE